MKITLLSIGKTTDKYLVHLIDSYLFRIQKYVVFQNLELPDIKNAAALSTKEIMEKESYIILNRIDSADTVILLDPNGKMRSSENFAKFLNQKQVSNTKHLVFIVGGAYGLHSTLLKKFPDTFSLSPMTFTHQMVRLIFCEQLYRAFTILNNEPYHHQ